MNSHLKHWDIYISFQDEEILWLKARLTMFFLNLFFKTVYKNKNKICFLEFLKN